MIALVLLAQAAAAEVPAAAPAAPAPQRWSILVPVPAERCKPRAPEADVVVCAGALPSQRLPYPDDVPSDRPRPSNPNLTGLGALAALPTPCAVRTEGCQVGFGPPILPIAKWLIDRVGEAVKAKPGKGQRVPILLDDPPAAPANAATRAP